MTFSLLKAMNIFGRPLATVWSGHFVVVLMMWKHVRTASYAPVCYDYVHLDNLQDISAYRNHNVQQCKTQIS